MPSEAQPQLRPHLEHDCEGEGRQGDIGQPQAYDLVRCLLAEKFPDTRHDGIKGGGMKQIIPSLREPRHPICVEQKKAVVVDEGRASFHDMQDIGKLCEFVEVSSVEERYRQRVGDACPRIGQS